MLTLGMKSSRLVVAISTAAVVLNGWRIMLARRRKFAGG
jgi:hypothetical protein